MCGWIMYAGYVVAANYQLPDLQTNINSTLGAGDNLVVKSLMQSSWPIYYQYLNQPFSNDITTFLTTSRQSICFLLKNLSLLQYII